MPGLLDGVIQAQEQKMQKAQQEKEMGMSTEMQQTIKSAIPIAMQLKDLDDEQIGQVWPGLVQKLAKQNPQVLNYLDPASPPNRMEIMDALPPEARDVRTKHGYSSNLDAWAQAAAQQLPSADQMNKMAGQPEPQAIEGPGVLTSQTHHDMLFRPESRNKLKNAYSEKLMESMASQDAKLMADYADSAKAASDLLPLLDMTDQMVTKYPELFGPGSGLKELHLKAKSTAERYGIGALTEKEKAALAIYQSNKTLTVQKSLAFIQQTKGSISDKEMTAFQEAAGGSTSTPEALRAITNGLRISAQRSQKRQEFFNGYLRKYQTLDGAQKIWNNYTKEHPVLNDVIDQLNSMKAK